MCRGNNDRVISTDILVIGGGMAGCFAAIKAKEQGQDVILTEKAYVGRSGATHYSEGDYTNYDEGLGHDINVWLHVAAINTEYLNNPEWTARYLKDSHARLEDLISWGVKFEEEDGKRKLHDYVLNPGTVAGAMAKNAGIEYFCMKNREYAPKLRNKALDSGVRIIDRIMISEIIKQDGQAVGAIGINTISGDVYTFYAKAVIIAVGSTSLKTANRPVHYWTADGEAMAYRAGAAVTGKEFWTRITTRDRVDIKEWKKNPPQPNLIENVDKTMTRWNFFRGDGGALNGGARASFNAEGMPSISPPWEAHCGQIPLYTNLTELTDAKRCHMDYYYHRLGMEELHKTHFDPYKGNIYTEFSSGALLTLNQNGGGSGIWPVDLTCSVGIPGLYAAGNALATRACSGAGYAGMGWGLSHAAVTGAKAADYAVEYASKVKKVKIDDAVQQKIRDVVCAPVERIGGFSPAWIVQVIHSISIPYFYLWVKHEERMKAALTIAEFINSHLVPKIKAHDPHEWRMALEAKNIALNVEMMLRASIFRKESRGGHYREDYPKRNDPEWLAWVKLSEKDGKMIVTKEQIPEKWWPDLTEPYDDRYSIYDAGGIV